jgi:U3 small nucleolar RNA-associated protein 22
MDGYDFVIYLEPSVLPRYAQNVLPDETVWSNALKHVNVQANRTPGGLAGFDPAKELLEDLQVKFQYCIYFKTNSMQRVYGDTIAFFYDYLGGTAIGCSWNPLVRQSKQFRALLGYTTKPGGVKKVSIGG